VIVIAAAVFHFRHGVLLPPPNDFGGSKLRQAKPSGLLDFSPMSSSAMACYLKAVAKNNRQDLPERDGNTRQGFPFFPPRPN